MKHLILLFASVMLFASCADNREDTKTTNDSNEPHKQAIEGTGDVKEVLAMANDPRAIGPEKGDDQLFIEEAQLNLSAEQSNQIYGYWVGDFGETNVINITIYKVEKDSVFGYSVCAGNFRELKGKVTNSENGMYAFDLNEPGDDTYDGHFVFEINVNEKSLNGTWKPFKEGVTDDKAFDLEKRSYTYDNTAGPFSEASQKKLTEEDVENLYAEELEIMRNAIYARHGYSFKNRSMRFEFNKQDWYMPMGVDIRDDISNIEAHNIDLIYRYESYAESYYDDYGR